MCASTHRIFQQCLGTHDHPHKPKVGICRLFQNELSFQMHIVWRSKIQQYRIYCMQLSQVNFGTVVFYKQGFLSRYDSCSAIYGGCICGIIFLIQHFGGLLSSILRRFLSLYHSHSYLLLEFWFCQLEQDVLFCNLYQCCRCCFDSLLLSKSLVCLVVCN